MKPIDIAEARRLYGKTTQGQWRAVRGELLHDGPGSIAFFENAAADSDAEFAAWSHNNTPVLLEEIEQSRTEKRRRVYYQDLVYGVCNWIDRILGGRCICGTSESPHNQLPALLEKISDELTILRSALAESVKLQSHYAGTLNTYDGGHRIEFSDSQEWLDRLALFGEDG